MTDSLPFLGFHAFIFVVSVLTALLEIQIEGKFGFAEKLPTWKVRWAWYRSFSNGKILTGYHLYLNLLLLLFFHTGFVFSGWSLAGELMVLSGFSLYIASWDFLWFALNPAFGLRRFSPKHIWWMRRWYGPFPADYYNSVAISGALASLIPLTTPTGPGVAATVTGWAVSVLLMIVVPTVILTVIAPYRPLVLYPKKN